MISLSHVVPQKGTLRITTEFGKMAVEPEEICILQVSYLCITGEISACFIQVRYLCFTGEICIIQVTYLCFTGEISVLNRLDICVNGVSLSISVNIDK